MNNIAGSSRLNDRFNSVVRDRFILKADVPLVLAHIDVQLWIIRVLKIEHFEDDALDDFIPNVRERLDDIDRRIWAQL